MTQEEIRQRQEEINNKYWNELTYKSSKLYIEKMHELDDVVKEGKDGLRRDDTYHGHEAPVHKMYKLGTLHRKDEPLDCGYEFLIEYDTSEPTVGIYYGCKCLFPEGVDPAPYISRFNEEWESVRNEVCTLLNNTFPMKDFTHRFKMTNNANNGTYWPFWITLYEDEDIKEVGLRATKIIRFVYKRMLNGEKPAINEEPKPKNTKSLALTAFNNKAYDELVESIAEKLDKKGKNSAKYISKVDKILQEFIEVAKAEKIGIIQEAPLYERAWTVLLPAVDFTFLIRALLDFIAKDKDYKISIPWENLCRLFMDKRQRPWGDSTLRTLHNKAAKSKTKLEEAKLKIKQWLE